jgi:hypothetical protein
MTVPIRRCEQPLALEIKNDASDLALKTMAASCGELGEILKH